MLNLPLGDMFALRLVGGDLLRSGWINLIASTCRTRRHAAEAEPDAGLRRAGCERDSRAPTTSAMWNGRATLLFKPNDDLSITLLAMDQRLSMGGYDLLDSSPTAARHCDAGHDLQRALRGVSGARIPARRRQIYGLTVNANVGFADLTSATSYFHPAQSPGAGRLRVAVLLERGRNAPLAPNLYYEVDPSHQFSQEVRLTSHDTGALHWVGGAFYSS
jgi:iron complex outermembrane receptor protein